MITTEMPLSVSVVSMLALHNSRHTLREQLQTPPSINVSRLLSRVFPSLNAQREVEAPVSADVAV